jgi:hypothetical protein
MSHWQNEANLADLKTIFALSESSMGDSTAILIRHGLLLGRPVDSAFTSVPS